MSSGIRAYRVSFELADRNHQLDPEQLRQLERALGHAKEASATVFAHTAEDALIQATTALKAKLEVIRQQLLQEPGWKAVGVRVDLHITTIEPVKWDHHLETWRRYDSCDL